MLDRFADWLDRQDPGRRRLYSVFIALALLTIPCYASATLLWFFNTPGAGPGATSSDRATQASDVDRAATLAIPTIGDEATDAPTQAPPPPTDRPKEKEDPKPTLAPRPTNPPLPSPTDIIVPTPVLRISSTPQPTLAPTEVPTAVPSDTAIAPSPEPTDVPTEAPALPSPTPPIQVTLDP